MPNSQRCRWRLSAITVLFGVFQGSVSFGATPAQEEKYQQALDAVLADVANPERSIEFVKAATDVGDMRGAAAALERILLIDPRLANIQLELGVLYLGMSNSAAAQYHIEEALKAQNVPDNVRARAERLLAAAGATSRRNIFRGSVSLAYGHNSNATAAPESPLVFVLNPFTGEAVPASLAPEDLEQNDSSTRLSANFSHNYAFSSGSGNSWDTNLSAYAIKYQEFSRLDQLTVVLDTGPTLVFAGSPDRPVSIRPFVSGVTASLDGDDYFTAAGGGLELLRVGNRTATTLIRLGYQDRTFKDSPQFFLSDRSGDYVSARLAQSWLVGRAQLGVEIFGDDVSAKAKYQSYQRWGGGLNARIFFGERRPWNLSFSATASDSDYDSPDPLVNPAVARQDTRYDVSLGLQVGITRNLSLMLDAGYTDNDSELPNYVFKDTSGIIGLRVRF